MIGAVFTDDEVLRPVVVLHFVDVVHLSAGRQESTQRLLGDEDVLRHAPVTRAGVIWPPHLDVVASGTDSHGSAFTGTPGLPQPGHS